MNLNFVIYFYYLNYFLYFACFKFYVILLLFIEKSIFYISYINVLLLLQLEFYFIVIGDGYSLTAKGILLYSNEFSINPKILLSSLFLNKYSL